MKKQTGAVVLAELLKSLGVTHIFMVPAVLRRTMVEIEKRTNIKRIHVHSEKSCVTKLWKSATRHVGNAGAHPIL